MHIEVTTRKPESEACPTPLLFVHGAWHGAWCWAAHFLPYFARMGYASHALSLRGHENSEGKLRTARIRDYVADVAQVADKIEAETGRRPAVIGHSMGGLVTQKYLETHDAPAAVLVASLPTVGFGPAYLRYAIRFPLSFLQSALTLNPYALVGTSALARALFFSDGMPEEALAAHFAGIQEESLLVLPDVVLFALPRPDRVSTPLLVLGAANDAFFTVREVERTARAYGPTAEFFPMAHDMMLDPGWQAVADRIAEWLREHGL